MSTFTATTYTNGTQARSVHAGVNHVEFQYASGSQSVASGDVIFLAKLPNRARVLDLIEDHSTGATTYGIAFGLATGTNVGGGASFSCFIATCAQATKNRLSVLGLPTTISLSDNDTNNFAILAAKVKTATTTTSLFINGICFYSSDGS